MIYLFLAEGFEEIEALATVDVLRRAGLPATTVGVGGRQITGSHAIPVTADMEDRNLTDFSDMEAVILPGGLPGTNHLAASDTVKNALDFAAEHREVLIAAICAAPSVLGKNGLLRGARATCYPGYEESLEGAQTSCESVVRDGRFITGKGAGVTIDFALEIVAALCSPEKAQSLKEAMQCK